MYQLFINIIGFLHNITWYIFTLIGRSFCVEFIKKKSFQATTKQKMYINDEWKEIFNDLHNYIIILFLLLLLLLLMRMKHEL